MMINVLIMIRIRIKDEVAREEIKKVMTGFNLV